MPLDLLFRDPAPATDNDPAPGPAQPWALRGRRALPTVVVLVVYLLLPVVIPGDFWLSMLCLAGIVAIGALGLNLLTGLSGQVSLGHAFFIGVGAYTVAGLGGHLDLPLIVWLPAAGIVGGLVGALFGPIALRLQGTYLVIATLGLVYLGLYLFQSVPSVTGGLSGESVTVSNALGPLNFADLQVGSEHYSRNQGMFWFIWAVVIAAAVVARNIGRGRVGRALRAIRDHSNVAVATGVPVSAYKVKCFVVSSAMAGVAGGLYASYVQFLDVQQWNLALSIEYITVIIIGGMASVPGTVAGAVIVGAVPQLLQRYSTSLPFLTHGAGDGGLSVFVFDQIIYAVMIIVILLFEPGGLAALGARLSAHIGLLQKPTATAPGPGGADAVASLRLLPWLHRHRQPH